MKTHIALALAGAALVSLPAFAQTTANPPPRDDKAVQATVPAGAMYEMKAGQWRATKLTGLNVYNNNNEKIGDINELIVDRDGKVAAVVIGVGGFLGMGEHLAAVPWEKIKWVDEPVRTTSATTTTTTTGSSTAPATTPPPAAGANGRDVPARTTTVTTDRPNKDAYRGYPDHAMLDMTKDQLKALPEVKYNR